MADYLPTTFAETFVNDALAAIALGRHIDLAREADFTIGSAHVWPSSCEVVVRDRRVRLQRRVMQVLVALARGNGRPVSREQLLDVCWGTVTVGNDAVNRCIQILRHLANSDLRDAFTIETIPRVGYRLDWPDSLIGDSDGDEWPALPDRPSIAVRPFIEMTGNDAIDYFTDGMMVDIVTALSRFPKLFVIASGTSLALKNDNRSSSIIARELGVRYILQGSVRRSNCDVRISVELVDTVAGAQIFADRFDGVLEEVFALQDKVAGAVAAQIEPTIVAAETRRVNARPTADLGAYEICLRVRHLTAVQERDALFEAIRLIERAVDMDPNYAEALAQACVCHQLLFIMGWSETPGQTRQKTIEFADRALRTGGEDPEILANVARALVFIGEDLEVADALVERALSQNKGSSAVWFAGAWISLMAGRSAEALERARTALRLDPRSPYRPLILAQMGTALVFLRRFDEAIPLCKEAERLRPEHKTSLLALVTAFAHLGRSEEAAAAFRRLNMTTFDFVIGIFRSSEDRELFRSGLAMAGAGQ
jgi:TolB-like protein/cytochrome c-type biogenesis protein CcmH/NrfG